MTFAVLCFFHLCLFGFYCLRLCLPFSNGSCLMIWWVVRFGSDRTWPKTRRRTVTCWTRCLLLTPTCRDCQLPVPSSSTSRTSSSWMAMAVTSMWPRSVCCLRVCVLGRGWVFEPLMSLFPSICLMLGGGRGGSANTLTFVTGISIGMFLWWGHQTCSICIFLGFVCKISLDS